MLKADDIIDYAMPLMNIERMAKQIHDLCLENKFGEARELTIRMSVEARVLQHVLYLMDEEEERRKHADTKTVSDWPHEIQRTHSA